jgi:hypothetical protein
VLSLKALAGSQVKCATGAQLERMNLPVELREFIQELPSPFIAYNIQSKRKAASSRSSERQRSSYRSLEGSTEAELAGSFQSQHN